MVRRNTTKKRDPDLEKIKKQREQATGAVLAANAETAKILEVKKDIESDIETKKSSLEIELANIRSDHEKKLKQLTNELETKIAQSLEITEKTETVKQESTLVWDTVQGLKNAVSELTSTRDDLVRNISILELSKNDSEEKTKVLQEDITTLSSSKETLQTEVSNLTKIKDELKHTIDIKNSDLLEANSDLDKTETKLTEQNDVLVGVLADIKTKNEELKNLNIDIEKAKTESSYYDLEKIKKDNETTEKIGNLAIIEKRVDDKIATLKKMKENFTVEELARMKMKPDVI